MGKLMVMKKYLMLQVNFPVLQGWDNSSGFSLLLPKKVKKCQNLK